MSAAFSRAVFCATVAARAASSPGRGAGFMEISFVIVRAGKNYGLSASVFLIPVDNDSAVLQRKFDTEAAPTSILRGDQGRPGTQESVVDDIARPRTIEDQTAQQADGLHRAVQDALAWLRIDDEGFVFGFVK